MTNISETQSATCRKVEKHLINYSAGEVTKASSSTVMSTRTASRKRHRSTFLRLTQVLKIVGHQAAHLRISRLEPSSRLSSRPAYRVSVYHFDSRTGQYTVYAGECQVAGMTPINELSFGYSIPLIPSTQRIYRGKPCLNSHIERFCR
jgi:hypothetical protein